MRFNWDYIIGAYDQHVIHSKTRYNNLMSYIFPYNGKRYISPAIWDYDLEYEIGEVECAPYDS